MNFRAGRSSRPGKGSGKAICEAVLTGEALAGRLTVYGWIGGRWDLICILIRYMEPNMYTDRYMGPIGKFGLMACIFDGMYLPLSKGLSAI